MRDAVMLNAAAALAAQDGLAGDLDAALREGMDRAATAIDSGAAAATLSRWVALAQKIRSAAS